ncbi:MAG: Flagellar biosynthetic protein FliP [Chlamydiales bacterium]|nr:Flagellar biosynthetic protein FliP [Chlamydiales bacterium]MCH9635192.1 Flagellar biosynthetic protein FliP [Chlamydiales bacterium]MCH9704272.1 flagellar type III secretion system pore protein FliP [Chlamydiota bacterium]
MVEQLPIIGTTLLIAIIPFMVVMMTSFTRISIVLTFLRQALATSVPSAQIIIGLSLILTVYIMQPVISTIHKEAVTPYLSEGVSEKSVKNFVDKAWPPLRNFMLYHTREKDLQLFLEMGDVELPQEVSESSFPWYCVIPSFVLSELRVAFMLGFLLFLPFLIIDMVVTSLLMSMGMVLLPPVMISFPFKILLFVVVDGWRLVIQQVVHGYF